MILVWGMGYWGDTAYGAYGISKHTRPYKTVDSMING